MFGICKLSLFVRDKSVLKNVYNLSGVSKLLENVKSSQFYPLKDSVSLFIEEPNESTKELVDSEILSLYHQIYPQILQHSLGENLTDMNVNLTDMNVNLRDEFVNLRRKLVDMQNSLFSGSLHTLNYHKILLQVLQGVGGEESGKFAAELYDMYANICNLNNLKHIKHPNNTLEIFQGLDRFRYEFGVHRVQRVPFNSRRIQTSSAVVTVVPHFNVEDINIKSSDLMVETMRSSGSGGQSVNKSETAVRITHIPTGITTSSRTTSSQIDNKVLGMEMIKRKIKEKQEQEIESMKKDVRMSQYRTGDRSERIRTINYPHDSITDHRCKVTLDGVDSYLSSGHGIEKIHQALTQLDNAKIIQFLLHNLNTITTLY